MNKFTFIILTVFLFPLSAFSQSYIWANKAASYYDDYATAIVKDNAGNLYLTGYYTDSVFFGGTKVKSSGGHDIFVVKIDPSGATVWAKTFGGNYSDQAFGISLDNSNNIYITGYSNSDSAKFDTFKIYCSSQQIFVAKLNSTGNCLWVNEIGDENRAEDMGLSLSNDANGNVYVTGYYQGTASFGNGISISSVVHPLYLTPSVDIFVAKFNTNGVCQWANTAGSYQTEKGFSIATDASGKSYVTGFFMYTSVFNGVSITAASGFPDGFVAVYNTSGALTQLKAISGTEYEACYGITLDGAGNYYITGLKDGMTSFDSLNIQSYGSYDMFLAKYDVAGNVKWVRTTQGSQWEEGKSVRCDANGDPYVAGDFYFNGTTPFPPYPFPGQGGYDAMIVKYNRHGEFQWAQKGGSTGYDYCSGIAITDSGKVYACGGYEANATFGPFSLPNNSGSSGYSDLYYVKLRTDITTGTLAANTYCGGAAINIPFVAHVTFNPANVFTAQLSDANGKFAQAVNIGSLAGTTSGTINAVIPLNTLSGSGYRVRVVSSDTTVNGTDNGANITINSAPSVLLTANDSAICTGDSALLSTPNAAGNTYKWYFNNVQIAGALNSSYYAKQTGTYKVRVTNAAGCSVTSSNLVVTVNNYPNSQVTASGPLSFCKGDSVVLTASSGTGYSYQWKRGTVILSNATQPTYSAKSSGNYKVVVTNAAGCSSLSTNKKVTVFTPVAAITSDSVTFCPGDSLKLQANIGVGYSYQWKKGTANISGATNSVFYAKTGGTYKVVVTDSNNCSVTSNKISIFQVSCRLGNVENETKFTVSPNPSLNGRFTLTSEEPIQCIRVLNLLGHELISEKVNANSYVIDLNKYATGFYLLYVNGNNTGQPLLLNNQK